MTVHPSPKMSTADIAPRNRGHATCAVARRFGLSSYFNEYQDVYMYYNNDNVMFPLYQFLRHRRLRLFPRFRVLVPLSHRTSLQNHEHQPMERGKIPPLDPSAPEDAQECQRNTGLHRPSQLTVDWVPARMGLAGRWEDGQCTTEGKKTILIDLELLRLRSLEASCVANSMCTRSVRSNNCCSSGMYTSANTNIFMSWVECSIHGGPGGFNKRNQRRRFND